MKLNDYKTVYKKIETNNEMDEKILSMEVPKQSGNVRLRKLAYTAAALLLIVGLWQTNTVQAVAKRIADYFINEITIDQGEDTEPQKIEMKGEYLTIKSGAFKGEKKYGTLRAISEELGIPLLASDEAYESEKNLITYTPYISENGTMYGVMLTDSFYTLGDIKNVNTEVYKERENVNMIRYEAGEIYESPISMQITVRADQNKDDEYINHELEYAGLSENISVNENISHAEVYNAEKLNTQVVISTVKTDGLEAWQKENGDSIEKCTTALFVYQGVEYQYIGAVEPETMKKFIDTLKLCL